MKTATPAQDSPDLAAAATLSDFPPELIARAAKLVREQMDREERLKKIEAAGLAGPRDVGLYEVEDAGWHGFVYARHLHPKPELCGHHCLSGELGNFSRRVVVSDSDRAIRLRKGDVLMVGEGCAKPDHRLRRIAPGEEAGAVSVEDAAVFADALDRLRTTEAEVAAASEEISERSRRIEELKSEIRALEVQREKLATGVSARRQDLDALFSDRPKEWKERARKVAEELPGLLLVGEEWHERYR